MEKIFDEIEKLSNEKKRKKKQNIDIYGNYFRGMGRKTDLRSLDKEGKKSFYQHDGYSLTLFISLLVICCNLLDFS